MLPAAAGLTRCRAGRTAFRYSRDKPFAQILG